MKVLEGPFSISFLLFVLKERRQMKEVKMNSFLQ